MKNWKVCVNPLILYVNFRAIDTKNRTIDKRFWSTLWLKRGFVEKNINHVVTNVIKSEGVKQTVSRSKLKQTFNSKYYEREKRDTV